MNRRWIYRAATGLGLFLLAGCGKAPQSILDPAGPVAETQLELLSFDLKMVTAIGLVVIALILYVIIRFRARPGDTEPPKQVEGNRKLEIGWTLAAILVLVPLAIEPIGATFALDRRPEGGALKIHVVGHQWWWEFQYPDASIITANELVIPVGRTVDLSLTSADVIHSFWAPRLGGKIDLLPGRTTHLWIKADEPGEYLGQCAELCGTSHANMRMRIFAKPEAEYEAWVQQRRQKVEVASLSQEAQGGWKTFNDKGCFACHTVEGTTAKGKVGPNLTGVASRTTLAAGVVDNTTEYLGKWLHDPQAIKPSATMPNLNLSPEEIQGLTAFLQSLK